MLVGDDVALRVVDEAGALGLRGAAALAEEPAGGALGGDGDLDDARRIALVDVTDVEPLTVRVTTVVEFFDPPPTAA